MSILLRRAMMGSLSTSGNYDPYFEQVYSLLHLDGANNSTEIVNAGFGGVVYSNNSAVLSTVAPKFGTAALRLDNINDRLFSNAAAVTYLNQDFTEEAWVRFDSITGNLAPWSRGDYAGAGYEIYLASDNTLNLFGNNAAMASTSALGLVANTYYHIAVVRRLGIWTIWVDGVLRATSALLPFLIGGASQVGLSGWSPNCYIDEYRLTNGVARYTTNFTPPTAAFADASAARVYATLNPSEKAAQHTLSNGNLTLASSSSGGRSIATAYKNTGKWFYEVTVASVNVRLGWGTLSGNIGNNPGDEGGSFGWTSGGGVFSGGGVVTSTVSWTAGDVLGVALDYATGWIKLYKNGALVLNDYNIFGATPTFRAPMGGADGAGTLGTFNFGATAFVYGPPAGYSGYVEYTTQYATWNPSDKGANATLSLGNLTSTDSVTPSQHNVRSTLSKSSGKWYWEVTIGASSSNLGIGFAQAGHSLTSYIGSDTISGCYAYNGFFYYNNATYGTTGSAYTTGDVIGVALDMDSGYVSFFKNGVIQTQAIPVSGTVFPSVGGIGSGANVTTTNFGQSPFKYNIPAGYNPGIYAGTSISAPAQTYATWNPADKNAQIVLSMGNLTQVNNVANIGVRATTGKTSGKWYWEVTRGSTGETLVGVGTATATLANYLGFDANGVGYDSTVGSIYKNNSVVGSGLGTYNVVGDTIGVALNQDTGTVAFYRNGVLVATYTHALSGAVFPMVGGVASSQTEFTNFGQFPFKFAVPAGFNPGVY